MQNHQTTPSKLHSEKLQAALKYEHQVVKMTVLFALSIRVFEYEQNGCLLAMCNILEMLGIYF